MKKIMCVILCPVIFFAGCAGRDPKPISIYQPGDENLNCDSLKSQVNQLQDEMEATLPKTDKFLSNVFWAATGLFTFFVGCLFMDVKDAEKIEFEAMRQRHNKLLEYIKAKSCDVSDIKTEPIPSLETRKKEAEAILKKPRPNPSSTQSQTTQPSTAK